jgi:hypothetical protein
VSLTFDNIIVIVLTVAAVVGLVILNRKGKEKKDN